jgi:hypothetical protein
VLWRYTDDAAAQPAQSLAGALVQSIMLGGDIAFLAECEVDPNVEKAIFARMERLNFSIIKVLERFTGIDRLQYGASFFIGEDDPFAEPWRRVEDVEAEGGAA